MAQRLEKKMRPRKHHKLVALHLTGLFAFGWNSICDKEMLPLRSPTPIRKKAVSPLGVLPPLSHLPGSHISGGEHGTVCLPASRLCMPRCHDQCKTRKCRPACGIFAVGYGVIQTPGLTWSPQGYAVSRSIRNLETEHRVQDLRAMIDLVIVMERVKYGLYAWDDMLSINLSIIEFPGT